MMKKIIIFGLCILFLYFLLSRDSTNQTWKKTSYDSSSNYVGNNNDNLNNEEEVVSTFHGYECTEDCGGHEAGYEWAEEKGIDDPEDCGGNSDSFIEGCQAYAEENY